MCRFGEYAAADGIAILQRAALAYSHSRRRLCVWLELKIESWGKCSSGAGHKLDRCGMIRLIQISTCIRCVLKGFYFSPVLDLIFFFLQREMETQLLTQISQLSAQCAPEHCSVHTVRSTANMFLGKVAKKKLPESYDIDEL